MWHPRMTCHCKGPRPGNDLDGRSRKEREASNRLGKRLVGEIRGKVRRGAPVNRIIVF